MSTQDWARLVLCFYVGAGVLVAVVLIVSAVLNVMDAERIMRGRWRR